MDTIACIIARTASTRLPKKVLLKIEGKTLIEHLIEKIKKTGNVDKIYLCTSTNPNDEILLKLAKKNHIESYAGSENSPIDRMLDVAEIEHARRVIRITGDNIFTDEIFLRKMISEQKKNPAIEYSRTEYLPIGVTAEVMKTDALKRCYQSINPEHSEYLMVFMFDPEKYRCQVLIPEKSLCTEFTSLTVDTPNDFERTKFIFDHVENKNDIRYSEILKINSRTPIPFFNIDKDISIKLPDDKKISYSQFRQMMSMRIDGSEKIILPEGFYENCQPA